MLQILDRDGKVISQSRNLRGIRRYAGKHVVKILDISNTRNFDCILDGGLLSILFEGGVSFQTDFASFEVLRDFVRRWRNVWGAPLLVNGENKGEISYHNSALQ